MALDNDGWVYQGRQEHGWFGTGTKPKTDEGPPNRDPADAALFAPRNLGERIDYAARATIGFVGRQDQRHATVNPDAAALARLRNAMTAWYGARALSRDAFRAWFLDPYTSDAVVDGLRAAAGLVVEASSHAELGRAGAELAGAMQSVGLGNWPRFVARAEGRAVEAVSRGEVPGVAKTGGEAGDAVLSATFLPDRQGSGTQVSASTAGLPKPAAQEGVDQSPIPVNYFTGDPNHAARALGLGRTEVGNAIHKLKDAAGLRGDDDLLIHIPSGEVYFNGESIGNLRDE